MLNVFLNNWNNTFYIFLFTIVIYKQRRPIMTLENVRIKSGEMAEDIRNFFREVGYDGTEMLTCEDEKEDDEKHIKLAVFVAFLEMALHSYDESFNPR